jgi:hypothetical protein
MFYHAYDSYITYAFPHDELKPLSKTYTDSLGEDVPASWHLSLQDSAFGWEKGCLLRWGGCGKLFPAVQLHGREERGNE